MKGQATLIGYVTTVAFSVVIIVGISAFFFNYYNSVLRNEINQEFTQIAGQTSYSIAKLYSMAKDTDFIPKNHSSILLSELNLNLPEKIGTRNYELRLDSSDNVLSFISSLNDAGFQISPGFYGTSPQIHGITDRNPIVEFNLDIPDTDIIVQGKTNGGPNSTLRFYRYNLNDDIFDLILLDESYLEVSLS
jgi:hypothetical protein